jgi:hypothetical protein
MGGAGSKQQNMPIPLILKRIQECMIPDERETVFDFIEMLDSKFLDKATLAKNSTVFKENSGVQLIFKIMKAMMADDVCISLGVQLFDRCKTRVNVIMDFIQFGGLDLLDRVMKDHEKNKILMSEVNKLLKSVLFIGAQAAISEIRNETDSLAICSHCQAALDRKRRLQSTGPVSDIKTPTPLDRIRRVLTFMRNYADKWEVLKAGLDACIAFAANKDAERFIHDTAFVETVALAVKQHGERPEIMWRACSAATAVCNFSQEIAASFCRQGVHDYIAEKFNAFHEEPRIQMSIFWLIDSFLRYELGPSRRRVWQSHACMGLFADFQQKREKQLSKAVHADKFLVYKVTLPLSVRAFMRVSNGEVLPEDLPPPVQLKEFPKRRNFDEHAKFGHIDDEDMKRGEKGLIDTSLKADGSVKRDYEDKLQYGNRKPLPDASKALAKSKSSKV